jgi:type I restriction enzyme S subunit
LQLAVQGKLVPQDPNDESASILLDKIQFEKELLIKEGKIKKNKQLSLIEKENIPFNLPPT